MLPDLPLHMSNGMLAATGLQMSVRNPHRIPRDAPVIVVSNHRSIMDVPVLMAALERPIRFACHRYMTQVPVLKDMVELLGCLPLGQPQQGQQSFFEQSMSALDAGHVVGIFPEGAQPMIQATCPNSLSGFQRGFAHLALRHSLSSLAILPVAIAAHEETVNPLAPLKLFSLFAPSEPLFHQPGWHPSVTYHRVSLSVGHPIWITPEQKDAYQGKQAGAIARSLAQTCHTEVETLLHAEFSHRP